MELNTPKPDSLTDATLLRLILRLFEIEHLSENLDGRKSFATMLNVTVPHIDNCLDGRSHLGIEQWTKIVAKSGVIAQAMFKKYLIVCERRANNDNGKEKK
jgi:hypothetical protein